ncbi:MAG: neutral/alkaline ceramidase [Myxococcota bacterium]|nr:neutral/alkaline ceramidase [Myxococcota bacterium]
MSSACEGNTSFSIGAGIYDITGPAAEVGMMGYAQLAQKTAGIHQRLRSRAFVLASPCNNKRVVVVDADLAFVTQGVKQQVIERLQAKYGGLYSDENVLLSATHTHSGPGGYSHYAMYNLTTFGFIPQNFEAIVAGITASIVRAHANLRPGTLAIAEGELLDTSINRSPEAYLANPAAERARYAYDTDKKMTLLRMQDQRGVPVGMINWFAVHGTSMGNSHRFISGDNKGYASYLFEKAKGTDALAANTFVAAFAQTNAGDSTPNIYGGTDGGGADDFESTMISGQKQATKAMELFDQTTALLTGGINYRHAYIKMDSAMVAPQWTDGQERPTCTAAIGVSMLAGAEDGPGFGSEGFTCADFSRLWKQATCAVTATSCQTEKPIVLTMGAMKPSPWTPEVLPIQVITIGNLGLVAVPFEVTTMAGRRLRDTVLSELAPIGVQRVIIAAIANAYTGYLATREEYAVQAYEGASTHFGPWQLALVEQESARLAAALREGLPVDPGEPPRDLRNDQTTLQTGVVFDDKLLWTSFGGIKTDANASYTRGQTARVVFVGAHPKNNLHTQGTFLEVQRKVAGSWVAIKRDWDWDTKYMWERFNCVPTLACSHVTVEWQIPSDTPAGTYRIRHYGDWKSGWDGKIRPYTGTSREFTVK